MKILACFSVIGLLVGFHEPALANCREEVANLKKVVEQHGSKFTLKARIKARKELAQAQVNAVRPARCRSYLREAKVALREGRR